MPVVMVGAALGPDPARVTCPNCHQEVVTSTDSKPTSLAYIAGGVLCLVGCWLCFWIPCCMDSMKEVQHRCPRCHAFLGSYKRA